MAEPSRKVPVIECDKDLYIKISTGLQFAIVGKEIFYSDSLVDLVNRHCPHLYELAEENGFYFIPSDDKSELTLVPPDIRFDVVRITDPALAS